MKGDAAAAERLAVLLSAGIGPLDAWTWVTGERTDDVPAAMRTRGWAQLALAWTVAIGTGAALAPALRGIASGLRDADQAEREVAAALAGPIATARLVLALPAVGVVFGAALGFDTVRTLFATPLGWVCLGVAGVLLTLAWAWNRLLLQRTRRSAPPPGLGCELVVVALGGGGSPAAALASVEALGVVELAVAREVLALSERSGAPASALLRLEAHEARRSARSAAQVSAARLGVWLMLPLGLCVLPAFFAVGVVPVLATILTATLAG